MLIDRDPLGSVEITKPSLDRALTHPHGWDRQPWVAPSRRTTVGPHDRDALLAVDKGSRRSMSAVGIAFTESLEHCDSDPMSDNLAVEQHEVRSRANVLERIEPVLSFDDVVPVTSQPFGQRPANQRFVVNDKDLLPSKSYVPFRAPALLPARRLRWDTWRDTHMQRPLLRPAGSRRLACGRDAATMVRRRKQPHLSVPCVRSR